MEAVTARFVAAVLSHDISLDDITAQHQHHPVNRADEFKVVVTPAHALRHGQQLECLFDHAGQEFRTGLARLGRLPGQPGALVGLESLQLVDTYAAGACKSLRRFGRPAVVIKGGLQCRAATRDVAVWLPQRHLPDQDRQPARRGERRARAVRQMMLVQLCIKRIAKGIVHAPQCMRWQFLGADLDQQVRHGAHEAASPASRIGKPRDSRRA